MAASLEHPDRFVHRHVGPRDADVADMLRAVGAASLDDLIDQTVPPALRLRRPLALPAAAGEAEMLEEIRSLGRRNRVAKSFIGMGYSDCVTPPILLRGMLENPGFYTAYTPYQAEVAQGRLEAMLAFQTMIVELTGLEVAGASLLDEATAAAEAMHVAAGARGSAEANAFFVSELCHPQTIEVVRTRAGAVGVDVVVGDHRTFDFRPRAFGVLVQQPATDGALHDWRPFVDRARAEGALVVVAADPLSLALCAPPGEWGADVAVGSTQRFGVPLGWGGPHAAYFAARRDLVRRMPGRIIGVARDARGTPALRMALQTREQHIRREKATSNICTAQTLLASVAAMYAVWHGPDGLRAIAERVRRLAAALARGMEKLGARVAHPVFFDTVRIEGEPDAVDRWLRDAEAAGMNLRRIGARAVGISLDETTSPADVEALWRVVAGSRETGSTVETVARDDDARLPAPFARTGPCLRHPLFGAHRSETAMLRYLRSLERRDLSLDHSMIPLGSCTMKLNAAAEMMPVTWPDFARLHPFCPPSHAEGYARALADLGAWLGEITGLPGVSFMPNAGSQGEYTGLLVIRRWHEGRGEGARDVCLIPASAHGTNPASAVMAGCKVVVVACDDRGNVDLGDLERKARENARTIAALMVTYPSTHGVFEEDIRRVCDVVHAAGGQVYMDGANMNAMVGLCRPGDLGADVCHLNLHKTFCIPHGGGGPGMGPIAVAAHLAPLLPRHPVVPTGGERGVGPVAAAPFGSPSIALISWAYVRMMGPDGLERATRMAILNANYVAARLDPHFPVVYRGARGRVAHECIVDLRPFKKSSGVEAEDVAKRLMDYGFHAPTLSFPIPGTLMIEPTESEPREELDRFCDAMIAIRGEIAEVEAGRWPRDDNPLRNAPHTADAIAAADWRHPYSRETAVFPLPWVRAHKFWPPVGRIDSAYGDRNLVCVCPAPGRGGP